MLPYLMVFWALIAPSSLLYYLGLKGLHSTLITLALALTVAAIKRKGFHLSTIVITAGLICLSFGNVIQWGDYRYLFFPVFFLCALVLTDLAGIQGIKRFSDLATSLMLILLAGAVCGAIVAGVGVSPLITIPNPDGQNYYFFYTTFTNSYQENIIRAAGIYDEPGAFSMYVCFAAALRHILQQDRKTTWVLLALGFITFSLAHFIYVLCHFLAEQNSKKKIFSLLGGLIFAIFVAATTITLDTNIVLLSRLRFTEETNSIAGDNRSFQLFNAWDQITDNPSSIFFGLDSTCEFAQTLCQDKFGLLGENPLSPLAFGGLSSELPYYIVLLVLFVAPIFGKRNITLLGVGMLFLQRPYVMGFSYALIAATLLQVHLRQTFNRHPDKRSPAEAAITAAEDSFVPAR